MTFRVPDHELVFRASRAGGPGGQHVNTSATRVEALWNVRASTSLTNDQRNRLLTRLASRLDASGVLRVVAAERRSQLRNRLAAEERLRTLVAEALRLPKPRRPTRPSRGAVEARLAHKRRRQKRKQERRRTDDD
ncbi:MAG TPA: alternative ribosome rescue aminoacyl-tRNA hydrolase ArfB [Gemmatimonadales bacterium]|nr:alternative ribosome rescue aminoacyl-tRNA hydrolase ArfB [Gemmatimonadales bacterium]